MASKSKQARLAGRQKSAAEPAQSPNSSSKLDLQGPGIVTATSQTSRFHVDTLSTLSKEIDLHQVNIAYDKKDILVDAHLRIKSDVVYGLVGRNGEGKSTILKAISDKTIPGISENMRILLVGQVSDEEAQSSSELSVVNHVIKADARREKALWEYKILSSALDSPDETSKAVRTVIHSRSIEALEIAKKISSKRSGTRGADARKALLLAEEKVESAAARLQAAKDIQEDSNEIQQLQSMLEEVQQTLESLAVGSTEATARRILLGLGFSPDQLDAPFASLSGGWRSRCALAIGLVQCPDILILDEPTNYLDIPSVMFLQTYILSLAEKGTTAIIVAHDRAFLDDVSSETIVLRNQSLTYYEGSFSSYERAMHRKRKTDLHRKDVLDKKRTDIEKSIATNAKLAKKTGDDNRARMVKSRQKKLDERWGAEVNEKGHRFKLNRDLGGYHLTNRNDIIVADLDPPVSLPFPEPEKMRFPGALCSASAVSFRYPSKTPGINVLRDVTLTIHPGDRIGLVGKNGEGKSTLVKLLIGQLKPTSGTVEQHPRLRLGYYSQHSVEELSPASVSSSSSLEYFITKLQSQSSIKIDEGLARGFLGSFGLRGQIVLNPIGALSGGQKVRLALALTVYPAPDLLVLDEVSTHLDMDTTTGLIRALRSYAGAVLLVSHDRHLVKCVIEGGPIIPRSDNSELAEDSESESGDSDSENNDKVGVTYRVGPQGKLRALAGGVDDYVRIVEKKLAKSSI